MPTIPGSPPFLDPYLPAPPVPRRLAATPTAVYRFQPGATPDLTLLPNVQAVTCRRTEGADPGSAVFKYDFTWPDARAPKTIQQALSGTALDWTVTVNFRLAIRATRPDSSTEWLFDGEVYDFRAETRGGQTLYIIAHGIAKRLWSVPIKGQLLRDSVDPTVVDDFQTDLAVQFNPKGVPNASPSGADAGTFAVGNDKQYPTFVDPLLIRTPEVRRAWTLPMAARHLLFVNNAAEAYVKNPDGTELDNALVCKMPRDGEAYDPEDPGTYDTKQLTAADTPMKDRDLPTAFYDLIRDYGFGYEFKLDSDGAGKPRNTIRIMSQQEGEKKPLLLQAPGEALDRGWSNTTGFEAHRDLSDLVNEWEVAGALKRYEASFILKPAFPSNGTDASPSTLPTFDQSSPTYDSTNIDAYRTYVLSEAGDGYYEPGDNTKVVIVPNLDALFGAPVSGVPQYARRRRKPLAELLTKVNGKPLRARLWISKAYTAAGTKLWDHTQTDWQPVTGGWELLHDRIGIRLTGTNPNAWHVGPSKVTGAPFPLGIVQGVALQATGTSHFNLMLTVCVDGDTRLKGTAARRFGNELATVRRVIDATDRYRHDVIDTSSYYNTTGADVTARDDTDAAEAEAAAVRFTTESGVLRAEFEIPHVTTYYQIGDRIEKMLGTELGFRTNNTLAGDAPVLPVVVAVRHEFQPKQRTYLTCTDAGTARGKYKRAAKDNTRHV